MWMQALRLSEEQQEQLLRMRQNHLKQLKEVYIQRQALNLKVCDQGPPLSTQTSTLAAECTSPVQAVSLLAPIVCAQLGHQPQGRA